MMCVCVCVYAYALCHFEVGVLVLAVGCLISHSKLCHFVPVPASDPGGM